MTQNYKKGLSAPRAVIWQDGDDGIGSAAIVVTVYSGDKSTELQQESNTIAIDQTTLPELITLLKAIDKELKEKPNE